MVERKYIKIDNLQIKQDKTLLFKLSFSKSLRRYFSSNNIYIKYDKPIDDIGKDILYIPCVGGIITLAWAIGSDVYVDNLDATYIDSLNKVKEVLNDFYPKINFKGNLYVKNIVSNRFFNERYGLLFSGGVDSTTLYIQNRDLKPDLFTIFGGIIPVHNRRIIKKLKNSFLKFAARENINIFFIETNAREVLNEALLFGKFGKYINYSLWWEGVNHGLVQLSLCAPLTVREIGLLKIASSATNVNRFPYGSDPRLDSKISWGDIKISHEGVEFTRQEKIKFLLKGFIDVNNYYPKLQVCSYAPFISERFNCGYCEKCSRTIIGLLLENIDPTKCGFPILDNFFEHVKKDVVPYALIKDWKRIQDKIHNGTKCYIHNSNNFFDWLKNYDFSNNMPKSTSKLNLKSNFYNIFSKIPRKIQITFIKLYYNRKYLSHSRAKKSR